VGVSIRRVSDLISDVQGHRLELQPFFQRRLVWTNTNKELLIDTVLKGFPFPEIFVASGSTDAPTINRKNWLVDGQQRITTLCTYVLGESDLLYKTVLRFKDLEPAQQQQVLDYEVAVRDLGTVDETEIREIFRRINSTDYALKAMERLNALFGGAYHKYCEELSETDFFVRHKVFSRANKRRMYDVTFCVILVTTLLAGYYRRDESNAEYLERYNDEFKFQPQVQAGLDRVFAFMEACAFELKDRAWKQTDLFTLLVELYSALVVRNESLDAAIIGPRLKSFFRQVDDASALRDSSASDISTGPQDVLRYVKAATKATNDKYSRVERAEVISKLLTTDNRSHSDTKGASSNAESTVRSKSPAGSTKRKQAARRSRKQRA
jgi:hypothetical protein